MIFDDQTIVAASSVVVFAEILSNEIPLAKVLKIMSCKRFTQIPLVETVSKCQENINNLNCIYFTPMNNN